MVSSFNDILNIYNLEFNEELSEVSKIPLLHAFYFRINYCDVSRLDPFCTYLSNSLPKLEYLSMMGNPAAPSFVNGGKFHDYIMYR